MSCSCDMDSETGAVCDLSVEVCLCEGKAKVRMWHHNSVIYSQHPGSEEDKLVEQKLVKCVGEWLKHR